MKIDGDYIKDKRLIGMYFSVLNRKTYELEGSVDFYFRKKSVREYPSKNQQKQLLDKIGLLFDDYYLIPEGDIYEVVECPLETFYNICTTKKQIKERKEEK